jgi:hypothetical protein
VQFWIKDQRRAKPRPRVLELDALELPVGVSGINLAGICPPHRPRCGVSRELSNTMRFAGCLSTYWQLFLLLPIQVHRTHFKTSGRRMIRREALSFIKTNPPAFRLWDSQQWLGFGTVGSTSSYTAVKHLDCAPACHALRCSGVWREANNFLSINYSFRVSHFRLPCNTTCFLAAASLRLRYCSKAVTGLQPAACGWRWKTLPSFSSRRIALAFMLLMLNCWPG